MVLNQTISLVIPCYNENTAIPVVVKRLESAREQLKKMNWDLEVLVVDDGSSDTTPTELSRHPIFRVITHSENLGYGQALKSGFAQAKGELIAMMDMDATYDPINLVDLLEHLQTKNLDVVFGNRLLPESDFSAWRLFGNRLFGFLFKHCLKLPDTDVCSGFRLFRRQYVPAILELPYRGFNLSIAMSVFFLTHTTRYKQVPISYSARIGESKLMSWYEGWTHLHVIFTQWKRR